MERHIEQSIIINAPKENIWKVLTEKEYVKQYMFDSEIVSDWKKGSSLMFRGEYEGQVYEDKGVILEIEPNKLLQYTYWSSMGKVADLPENYAIITYTIEPLENGNKLIIEQENSPTQEMHDNSDGHWKPIMEQIKSIAESI